MIDSRHAGADTGTFLDGMANGIPILADLGESLAHAGYGNGLRRDGHGHDLDHRQLRG